MHSSPHSPVAALLVALLIPGCVFAELGGSTVSPARQLSQRTGLSSGAIGLAAEIPYPDRPRGIRLAAGAGGSFHVQGAGQGQDTGPVVLRADISLFAHQNIYFRWTGLGELPLRPDEWADEPLGFFFGPTLTSGDEELAWQFTFGARWTRLPGEPDLFGIHLRLGLELNLLEAL